MSYPLQFKPIFQERIWGGRSIEKLYHYKLPPGKKIGEAWVVSDRPDAESEVLNGPWSGTTLHELMHDHREAIMGAAPAVHGRFPLLVKILDAREKLSLQVHPPADKAARFGGEPKTEMWYIAHADPGAVLYAGLRKGVTREEFERKVADGTVADCFHRIEVHQGDSMFLPSGRVHAIGAGLVIFEIQQNSDTTFRVFDWNRKGTDGKPRDLHVSQSLECIDFQDFEPAIIPGSRIDQEETSIRIDPLVEDEHFTVELVSALPPSHLDYSLRAPRVLGVISGAVRVSHPDHPVTLRAGDFCLLPAAMGRAKLEMEESCRFLAAQPGRGR